MTKHHVYLGLGSNLGDREATQQIERDLGKRKCHATKRQKTINYQDRPIDIDILLYDDLIVDEPDLKIPHPLMHQREFVMRPLNEIRDPQSL